MNSNGVGEADSVGEEMGLAVGNASVGGEIGVAVGMTICVSATAVPTVDMAVSILSVGLVMGVDMKLLQDASITAARNKGINVLSKIFTFHLALVFCKETLNCLRYRLL
ncbi:MAG TPA: hypothetical protein VK249_08700 [Anaerolineales bacterium]|nr:hypothetical protein [Anaerolineales bacterium]